MSTFIDPGDGRNWGDHFPEVLAETPAGQNRYAFLQSMLMLLAAWLSRGQVRIPVAERARVWALNGILTGLVHDLKPDADADSEDMIRLGRYTFWLIRALDAKPTAGRSHGRLARR